MKFANALCVTVAAMGSLACFAGGNHSAAFKDAQTKGADARVRLCVHDEQGVPIADSSVRATLANRVSDYSMHGVKGVRIRYSGIAFNPFSFSSAVTDLEDMYMGVRMIQKMVELVTYQRTFGVNTLQILLSED